MKAAAPDTPLHVPHPFPSTDAEVFADLLAFHTNAFTDTAMLSGIGSEVLARRAADALRAYRFEPARLDGRPVAVYFSLSVEMRSESGGG